MPAMGKLFGQINPTRDAAVVDAGDPSTGKALDHVERWLARDPGRGRRSVACRLQPDPQLFVLEPVLAIVRHPAVLDQPPQSRPAYWRRAQADPTQPR